MMQSGSLHSGLTAPKVALNLGGTVNPVNVVSNPPTGGSKGGGKGSGRERSLRSNVPKASPKKPATKTTSVLTQANAKVRDASSKLIDAKCWARIIGEKSEISQAMKDGYATDMKKHRELMQDATDQLQHATLTGPKDSATLTPLCESLDKALEGYNTFIKQVRVVFDLRHLSRSMSFCN